MFENIRHVSGWDSAVLLDEDSEVIAAFLFMDGEVVDMTALM